MGVIIDDVAVTAVDPRPPEQARRADRPPPLDAEAILAILRREDERRARLVAD